MGLDIRFSVFVEVNVDREELIKKLIKEKGMSIKSFSEFADIPYTTLHSMLERGIGKASVDNVIKVCRALDITVEELETIESGSVNNSLHTIAAHAIDDLTDEEQLQLINYAKFLKSQRNK